MGLFRDLLYGREVAPVAIAEGPTFAVTPEDIPPEVFGLTAYVGAGSSVGPAPRIDRRTAMQVPAVKRSRDLICGSLGGLPIDVIGPDATSTTWPLLEQPERNVPRSVTMTRLFEDLLFEQRAWWQVTEFGWHGFPVKVRRVEPRKVSVDEHTGRVFIDGKHVPDNELIRFDSPTDGLLIAGARAIRTCLALDAAAARFADEPLPTSFFRPSDPTVDLDDDDVTAVLDTWAAARQRRATGYVPGALTLETPGLSAQDIQLADARQHAVLEIARVAGVDAEELGVSTTSRTYANQFDRRKAFLDFTLGQFRQAVEDRLSMGDVSPRGYSVKFNLSAFLRSDDKTRMETYEIGQRVGRYTLDDIRDLEDAPRLTEAQKREIGVGAGPRPASTSEPLQAHALPAETTFAAEPAQTFDSPVSAAFEVDTEKRVIRGLALPYNKAAKSRGRMWQFTRSSLRWAEDITRVKLLVGHDFAKAVGVVTELDDREDGLYFAARVASGPEGDHALAMAAEGVWDGVSVGLGEGGRTRLIQGINHATEAPLIEISLTPMPSFTDARVQSVAASAAQEGNTMKCTKCGIVHAPGITECNAADVATFEAGTNGPTFDLTPITEAIANGFANLSAPQGRETVAAGGETFQVNEEAAYRFDGIPGPHSLTTDMRNALSGDSVARQRLDEFFNEQFAVTTANTGTLNPTENRPDLWQGNLQYSRPLWEMVSTGVITDRTPFTVPKFASASGLVGPHTEGVEPTPGAFAATAQTVTPGASSGKIEINREVLDQGGSPQADAIIWGEMVGAYYESIESRIATILAAVPTAEVNFASAVNSALVDQFTGVLAGLQFVRGGNRFTGLALDGSLFPALINAADTTGRKLLPVMGPTNANGQVSGAFDRVSIGGLTGRAAWALGAGNAAKSYLFVPSSVYAWASAPQRFEFQYQVKSVDIAIWGYSAAAVLRDSDVRPLDYTTADA